MGGSELSEGGAFCGEVVRVPTCTAHVQTDKQIPVIQRCRPAAPTNTLSTLSRSRHGRCFTRRATQRRCVPQVDSCLMLFASCAVFGALCVYTHARRSSHYLSAKGSTSHTTLKNANYLTTSLSLKKHHTSHETHTTPPSKYHLSRHNTTTS